MVASNQSDQPQSDNATDDFRCSICNKAYSRRDLRDRHRRRCLKTAGQDRPSKQKSCEACVQKKQRCSMTRPVCTRCDQLGTPCRYPPSSIPPRIPPSTSTSSTSSTAVVTSSSPPPKSTVDVVAGPSPAMDDAWAQGVPSSGQQSGTVDPFAPPPSASWSPFSASYADLMARAFSSDNSPLFAGHDVSTSTSLSWTDDFAMTDVVNTTAVYPSGAVTASTDASSSAFLALYGSPDPPGSLEGPQLGPSGTEAFPSTPRFSLASWSTPLDGSMLQDGNLASVHNSGSSAAGVGSGSGSSNSPQLLLADSLVPKLGPLTPQEAGNVYKRLFDTMREYPSLILKREFWTPFVHHQLYRCSFGGMAEPLGVVLACVSAHANSVESSYGFVDRMINQEREKLVRNFQSYVGTPETCLAALHAVCIYQILGLFGDNFTPATIVQPQASKEAAERRREDSERAAELHSFFLIKMTRRLCKIHHDILLIPHQDETDWNRWQFAESLRRNVFLVNMINILGAKVLKLSEDYYEPLDDHMVSSLPLPCTESMWRASSEAEWLVSREHTLASSAGQTAPAAPQTLQQLLNLDKTGILDVPSLLPLTQMILACAKIGPAGDTM